ncbi:MAG: hypothetical protein EBZ98_04940 [Actinobacteria bacterium]|nr:hypothetical protein [Actinomycetota bacterium]
MAHPLRHPEVSMSPKHTAATALPDRCPKKRTLVRFATLLVVAVAAVVLTPVQPVAAVPVSDRTATWIATTSRQVALELRDARELPESESRYVAERQIDELAGLVAYLLEADVDELRSAWTSTTLQRKIALFSALSQVGVPYKLNADAPFIALDCSALTRFAWAQAGVSIERGSVQQYERGNRVSRDTAQVVIRNEHWRSGMASSLQCAIAAARERELEAVVVGLGDQPGIPAAAWRAVAATKAPLAVATYGGKRRNPVRIHAELWSHLPTDGDEGARSLIRERAALVAEVACEGNADDIDTVDDVEKWHARLAATREDT